MRYLAPVDCSQVGEYELSGGGRVYVTYLQALKLLANPPLQATENGAISQYEST
ncbi:hypothetical protein QUB00_10365 [Microcoleus sp. F8_C2]